MQPEKLDWIEINKYIWNNCYVLAVEDIGRWLDIYIDIDVT